MRGTSRRCRRGCSARPSRGRTACRRRSRGGSSTACVAPAFVPGVRSLLALRAAEGLGETAYFPASVSLISDFHDERTRSRALGLHQTGVYVGTIGGTTVAALLAQRFGWRSPFLVFGVAGILLGVVLAFFIREPERIPGGPAPPAPRGAQKRFFHTPRAPRP